MQLLCVVSCNLLGNNLCEGSCIRDVAQSVVKIELAEDVLVQGSLVLEPVPGRGLACRCEVCDGLSERIISNILAALEGADEACIFYKELLAFVACEPCKEVLSLLCVVVLEYCPPGRRVGQDGVDAFLECCSLSSLVIVAPIQEPWVTNAYLPDAKPRIC